MKTDLIASIDYTAIFTSVPDLYLLIDRNFIIQNASENYLKAAMVQRSDIVGKNIFDVFPDNPDELRPTGVLNLRSSLERVLISKKPDTMAVQRYDIQEPKSAGGKYVERYWSPVNVPILNANNEVQYILHKVEDVTDFIFLKENENRQKVLTSNTQKMEKEIYQRAQEIQEANRQLRMLNEKLAFKDLEQKKLFDKLQRINQIKTQFFSSISHELRTPLTLVLAATKKLMDNDKLSEVRADLDLIERNAYELLRHVNDLLDISKLETKKMELYYSNCDLVKIIRHTGALFEGHASNKGIEYHVITPATIPAELDVQKIQRILVNLITNAFRFTPVGGAIECRVRSNNKHALIEIADSGPGIPLEMRDTLFNNFFHGRVQDQTKVTSLGLGLTIVKDFIELHGGTVRVDTSNLGGALFIIDLPLKAPNAAKIEYRGSDPKTFPKALLPELITELDVPPSSYISPNTFINTKSNAPLLLIVEDNVDMSHYISTVLEDEYQIITAFDGREGLEKAMQFKPDLIVADLVMPKMDGAQMMSEIRQHKELSSTPIIILTSQMDDKVSSRLLTEGAQDYLVKPFSNLELSARVANLIQLKRASDALQQKNQELLEANNELDAFGYSVSHDLRNPVQSIIGFCTLLLEAFNLEDEVRDYIKHIQYSGTRMQELINDLLILSHTLREEVNFQDINLSAMAKTILDRFAERDPMREVIIKIEKNLYALADEHLIEIVFDNLLSNAWKYTSKNENATIEFGMQSSNGNTPIYYIKDNGVGFEQTKANQLFVPFSRLHAEKDFPGTGVGLATVKRIIEKHGGRIWVESIPGGGTTFYFQLAHQS